MLDDRNVRPTATAARSGSALRIPRCDSAGVSRVVGPDCAERKGSTYFCSVPTRLAMAAVFHGSGPDQWNELLAAVTGRCAGNSTGPARDRTINREPPANNECRQFPPHDPGAAGRYVVGQGSGELSFSSCRLDGQCPSSVRRRSRSRRLHPRSRPPRPLSRHRPPRTRRPPHPRRRPRPRSFHPAVRFRLPSSSTPSRPRRERSSSGCRGSFSFRHIWSPSTRCAPRWAGSAPSRRRTIGPGPSTTSLPSAPTTAAGSCRRSP